MALPDKIDVQAGGWSKDGSPWVQVVLTGDPDSGEWSKDGSRWWGAKAAGGGLVRRLKVFISGGWSAKPLKWWNGSAWLEKELKE